MIQFGYGAVLVLSAVFPLLSSLVIAFAIGDVPRTGTGHQAGYLSTLGQGLREVATNPVILFIVALSSAILVLPGILDEYVGPLLYEKGFAKDWVTYLFCAIYAAQSFDNVAAHWFRRVPLSRLFAVLFLAGGILVIAILHQDAYAVIGLMVYFLLFALVKPLFAARLQEAIEGSARATVTSVSEPQKESSSR